MSKELVDFDKIFDSLVAAFGKNVVAVQMPDRQGAGFQRPGRYRRDESLAVRRRRQGREQGDPHPRGAEGRGRPAPRSAAGKDRRERRKTDGKIFRRGRPDRRGDPRRAEKRPAQRNVFPVLVSDALANRGVQQLLDFIVTFCPAPTEVRAGDGEERQPGQGRQGRPFRRPGLQDHFRSLHRQDLDHPRLFRDLQARHLLFQFQQGSRGAGGRLVPAAGQDPGIGGRGQGRRYRGRGQAEGDADRRYPDHQGRQDPAAGDHLPHPLHLLRHRTQGPGRRGQDLQRPAAHHGGGPDHQDAARPADQGTGHLRQRPAARRAGGQQAETQVRRGSDDEAAQDRLSRDRAWASPTSKRNTRSRAAAAASTATC